jgi:hypothetical protein
MTRVDLDDTAFVVLNGSGNGTAKIGPLTARETWYPEQASVKVSFAGANPTNEAICKIYKGDGATDNNFKDGTFTGSSGDATDKISGKMQQNNFIFAVWTGGDAGATAYLTVTGKKDV